MAVSSFLLRSPSQTLDPRWDEPHLSVLWSGGTSPYDLLFEWDDDPAFGDANGRREQVTVDDATGTTYTAIPSVPLDTADGRVFYCRVTITDNGGAGDSTVSATRTLTYQDNPPPPKVYLYCNMPVGVGFGGTDDPAGGWGSGIGGSPGDGNAWEQLRFAYVYCVGAVGFKLHDEPAGGWGSGVGGNPDGGDGDEIDFDRFHYINENIDATVPTPMLWYLDPEQGKRGWEFAAIGWGFDPTYAATWGAVYLNDELCGVITWEEIPASGGPGVVIDEEGKSVEGIPYHKVTVTVPPDGESGLVTVRIDDSGWV